MENNYYLLATQKHAHPLYEYIVPLFDDIPVSIEESFKTLATLYGYGHLINPPGYPRGVAGWHSHFPRELCLITEGVNPNRQIKTICHEIAHCVQSHAVETMYGYRHQGEIAKDFDTYLRYEVEADALAYEVYLKYFDLSIQHVQGWVNLGVEELDSKNFQSYNNTEGVCRLYRKWAMKKRKIGELAR